MSEHGEEPIAEDSYGVRQEVNTAAFGEDDDVADIVLDGAQTTIVIENYFSSDGHGHSYHGYRQYGARQTQRSVVVLLCEYEIRSALTDGWQNAPVVLYSRLLTELIDHVHRDSAYRSQHLEQVYFIENMHRHFTNRMAVTMNRDGLISFVDAMCRGDEADAFGWKHQDEAGRQLGDRLREEVIQRFSESRELLGKAKSILRSYCVATLGHQVNEAVGADVLGKVYVRWAGVHLWTVSFNTHPAYKARHTHDFAVHLVFGPSAWHALNRGDWKEAAGFEPDYTRLFLLDDHGHKAMQSTVAVNELLTGLAVDDHRLRDEIIELIR